MGEATVSRADKQPHEVHAVSTARRNRPPRPSHRAGCSWNYADAVPIRFNLTPKEYEDGVAELLEEKFAGHAAVERDVRLPSRSGVRQRQVDILVRIHLPGLPDKLMVVDCKRYGTKVDVDDVEAFIGMVEDIGAPLGMLVTTEGYTDGAVRRAQAARGIDVQVIRVDELPQWEPPLIPCEVCADAVPEDAIPGMAYVDRVEDVALENGDYAEVILGYCEKCAALYLRCPSCDTLNTITEWRTNEWIECEGGCGVEYVLRDAVVKDDLSAPTHDRLTLRVVEPL